ncbi:MAG: hypothetical protein JNK31_07110 [Candidatus Competibacter sp.]|nr:hypothetical protein [Candidatus Competibacter sp.]
MSRADAWARPAVRVVNALLVVALAYALAELTAAMIWNRLPLPINTVASVGPGALSGDKPAVQTADYAAVSNLHLFGRANVPQPVEAPPPQVESTPPNLRLVGVFFMERGAKALALIAEGTGLERSYRVGEALPGGARLDQIQRDSVVVSHGGQQQTLNLPRLEETARSSAPGDEQPPAAAPGEIPVPVEPAPTSPPEQSLNSEDGKLIDAASIAKRLRGAADRPQVLEDVAFASPHLQNGQFLGYRLRPGRDRRLLAQWGLKSGDVITEINGARLNYPRQGFGLLQDLASAERVSLRVLRNGIEIPLALSLGGPAVK